MWPRLPEPRDELTRSGAQIHMIADAGMVGDLPAQIYVAVAQDESKRIGEAAHGGRVAGPWVSSRCSRRRRAAYAWLEVGYPS